MFTKLTDYSLKRTNKQALGFYIAYLVVIIVLSMITSMLLAKDFTEGVRVGTTSAVVVCWVLSFLILKAKKKINDMKLVGLGVLSGILAIFGGGLLGLIPAAFLTTK